MLKLQGQRKNYILVHCKSINDTKNSKRIENEIISVKCIKACEEYLIGDVPLLM